VPGAPARPLSAREEADARSREREKEKDKKAKKGVKKPGSNGPSDTDLRGYMGSVQEIEAAEAAAMDLPTSARRRRRAERQQAEEPGKVLSFKAGAPQGTVTISEGMTLREFADKLGVKVRDLIKLLFDRGIVANINHVLEPELAQKLASELGVDAMVVSFEEEIQLKQEAEAPKAVEGRAARGPVVTIMGHVDHGKTSLLDAIRSSNVTATEFGGITQHIGAYHVEVGERKIVFLDTPGHEAFTLMRARGARVTDLVVLVVAADDGVMPQTVEAIDHARAAKVPIIVAINKIDKPNANPDRVKKELADRGLMVEEWGGQTVAVPVSALKKQGIQELLEMIVLNADLLALRCNPDSPAQGTVLEARKEVGRGVVATVLVQNGSLRVGDVYVAGATWGRVRAMADENGQRVEVAGPSTPVGVTGFSEVPLAGDLFQVIEEESKARAIVEFRRQEQRTRDLAPSQGALSLEQIFSQIERGEIKELPVVLKGDVQGSIEVLRDTIGKLSTDKVKVNVIHAAVGAISTNDVLLAAASKAIIVGFNIRPEKNAAELAEKEGIDIRLHTVIYELSDELLKAMTGLLDPVFKEVAKGRAEVRETFKVPKIGVVAGSHVVDGVIPRTAGVRLVRDGRVIYEGKISSLRRFKDDVSEVRSGFDCGIGLDRFQDVKPGDFIEAFVREQIAATL
jgi:translation initiation factor IF-2